MKAPMKARRRLEVVVVVGAAAARRRLERDLWDARLIVVVVKLLKLCCHVGSRRRGAWYPYGPGVTSRMCGSVPSGKLGISVPTTGIWPLPMPSLRESAASLLSSSKSRSS